MSNTNFNPKLQISNPFIAQGVIDTEYAIVQMYVGLIQTNGDGTVAAGAYGTGVPDLNPTLGAVGEQGWSMQLQMDSDKKPQFDPGPAKGFVVVQLRGGKVTGWLDPEVALIP
jgi:hypothetical protein